MMTRAQKVPLWRFIIDAHRLLWCDRVAVARFAAPWFLLFIIADAVANWAYFPRSQQQDAAFAWPDVLHAATTLALPLVIGSIVAVLLHRHLLLPEESITHGRPSAPPNLVVSYLGRTIAMQIFFCGQLALVALVAVVASYVFEVAESGAAEPSIAVFWTTSDLILAGSMALMLIPVSYIPVRISLALPATAIGSAARTFRASWLLTRGNFWRLFCGGTLSYWPFWLVLMFTFPSFTAESQTALQFIGDSTAVTVAICISDLIWVAFFSCAYRHLEAVLELQAMPEH